jgi:mannose-6-phosphate isomerase-like protein (cupin superfamily)
MHPTRSRSEAAVPHVRDLAALASFSPDKMTKVNLFDSPRMFCDLYCLEPGQAQAPHAHAESDKVYVVTTGRAVATLGDEEVEVGPGQAVLAAPGVRHGIANRTPERCVVLVFMTPKPPSGGQAAN